jgi:hypothetical protein
LALPRSPVTESIEDGGIDVCKSGKRLTLCIDGTDGWQAVAIIVEDDVVQRDLIRSACGSVCQKGQLIESEFAVRHSFISRGELLVNTSF